MSNFAIMYAWWQYKHKNSLAVPLHWLSFMNHDCAHRLVGHGQTSAVNSWCTFRWLIEQDIAKVESESFSNYRTTTLSPVQGPTTWKKQGAHSNSTTTLSFISIYTCQNFTFLMNTKFKVYIYALLISLAAQHQEYGFNQWISLPWASSSSFLMLGSLQVDQCY